MNSRYNSQRKENRVNCLVLTTKQQKAIPLLQVFLELLKFSFYYILIVRITQVHIQYVSMLFLTKHESNFIVLPCFN